MAMLKSPLRQSDIQNDNLQIVAPVTLVQARHLQIDSSLLSYSSRRPVDENIKLGGGKEEVEGGKHLDTGGCIVT
jgi:hypothetical protein